jgi:pullulanase
MYGEPWSALPPQMGNGAISANKDSMLLLDRRIGAFSDDTRNLLVGSPFDMRQSGYASGNPSECNGVPLMGAVHGWCDTERGGYVKDPQQVVQYVSCHDNFALWDRLVAQRGSQDFFAKDSYLVQENRLVSGIYLTLPGMAFLQSGEEFGRTKQGNGNSYTGPESLNRLDWNRMAQFSELVEWYRGLFALRKHLFPRNMTLEEVLDIPILHVPNCCIAFLLRTCQDWEQVMVCYNPVNEEEEINLPEGDWQLLCDGEDSRLWEQEQEEPVSGTLTLKPLSVTILGSVKKE